jgi:hypothetical protein
MKTMTNSIQTLLNFGWSDKNIASYLMIKLNIVRYYRRKAGVNKNAYQDFY